MTMLPLKTAISDTYPNPSNATARAGFAQMWDALNEFQQKSELDLASAATCDIGGQASTKLRITGTTAITSFGTNYRGPIMLRFSSAVPLTYNATTLRCPGGANYTTSANEVMMVWPIASVSGTLDGWRIASIGGGTLIGAAAITSGSITGITDLAIADGGTGASTASAAFTALKQAATTTATGVVELATDAEAMAGTDTTRALTASNLASGFVAGAISYLKLPGGFLLQWGYHAKNADVPTGFDTYQITFPVAFSAVYMVMPTIRRENNIVVSWDSAGTTNTVGSFFVREVTSGVQSAWDIAYIAIGKA